MPADTMIQTGILLALRATIFLACRRYVLSTLYSNLQDFSTASSTSTSLPAPVPLTPISTHKPRTLYASLSSTVFAGCFSESCMLFILLMLQGSSLFTSETRLLNWQFSLFLVLASVLIFIPFLFIFLLTGAHSTSPRLAPRFFLGTTCVLIALFALSFVPLPGSLFDSESESPSGVDMDLTTAALARLIVLGTIVLGLLAGVGAIRSVWPYLPSQAATTAPTEQDVATAAHALTSVREDLDRKREEEVRRRNEGPTGSGSWMARVVTSVRGDDDALELQGLTTLEHQMSARLDALAARRAAAKRARTLRGRMEGVGGRALAVYCALRVAGALVNLVSPPQRTSAEGNLGTSYPDIATSLLTTVLGHVYPESEVDAEAVARIVRHLSLVLVGLIIVSSIRMVLKGVTRALRVTSRSLGAALMVLVLAQIMGIYLLATIVQLRASFPPPSSPSLPVPSEPGTNVTEPAPPPPDNMSMNEAENNLLSTIPAFTDFARLFDTAFLVAAMVSFVLRWSAGRVRRVGGKMS